MASSAILIVPCCEEGRGGGHLSRCASLVKDLRALGREAYFFLPHHAITEKIENLIKTINFNSEWIITNFNIEKKYELIVLDRFQTPKEELLHWKSIAPVIGIDEGGLCRDYFDFLIDVLIPEKMSKSRANIASPALLIKKLAANHHEIIPTVCARTIDKKNNSGLVKVDNNLKLKVLITFGHEDTAGLGLKTARYLSSISNKYDMDITLLKGALAKNKEQITINNVQVIDVIPNLAEHLSEYDLVITHYGITAYEALFEGIPVMLAHPTPYHKKLTKASGFTDIKYIKKYLKIISNHNNPIQKKEILQMKSSYSSCGSRLKNETTLAGLINGFSIQVNSQCPVCGSLFIDNCSLLIARFTDRTYRRCPVCGIIFMDRTCPPPFEYAKEYFFESYKKQYGKTYLEDFENIKIAGKQRLKRIIKIYSHISSVPQCEGLSQPLLLDIGCAYGPFLSAAKEEGVSPVGIDPAEEAVRYVQEILGIPAIHGFFPELSNDSKSQSGPHSPLPIPYSQQLFDVVTLWFVIEHFRDCAVVLAEIKRILKPGGILAFSTPSFSGISARGMDCRGRKRLNSFLSSSPADHYTVWSSKMCKKALSLAGFNVKKIVSTGHHPERFPVLGKFAKTKKSPLYRLLLAISKLFKLGDTFEVYAQTSKKNYKEPL